MIIGLTGKRGTGKDTIANYLAEKHGFSTMDFTRDVLAPILQQQGREVTRDNLIDLAMEGRKKAHNGVWAEKLSVLIRTRGPGEYAISGVRFPEEVQAFKRYFGDDFILIAVVCGDRQRYERCKKRGTKGEGDMTFEQYMEREKKPTEAAITKTMQLADYAIDNNGTPEQLFEEVDRIVKLLKEQHG
jgi:dephospho-CoA kinase